MMRFQIEQRFINKIDPTLTAEVVELLNEGDEAFFEIRQDGVLARGYFGAYPKFRDSWTMVADSIG
jgi:hypothetical protein